MALSYYHKKPDAIIFLSFLFYGLFFSFSFFLFFFLTVCLPCELSELVCGCTCTVVDLWTSAVQTVSLVSMVSSTLERMSHANACFLFWICKCMFDGSVKARHTLDSWMSFSFQTCLAYLCPEPDALPLLFLRPLYPALKCEVWSSRLCAMIAVIGLKMESSLSLCHWTKKQFVFNECFSFFLLASLVRNYIASKHHLRPEKRGFGWWTKSAKLSTVSELKSSALSCTSSL